METTREVKIVSLNIPGKNSKKVYMGYISNLAALLDFIAETAFEKDFFPISQDKLREIAKEGPVVLSTVNGIIRVEIVIQSAILVEEIVEKPKDSIDHLLCDAEAKDCASTFLERA